MHIKLLIQKEISGGEGGIRTIGNGSAINGLELKTARKRQNRVLLIVIIYLDKCAVVIYDKRGRENGGRENGGELVS